MRTLTETETVDYLNGYRSFPGATETEHGVVLACFCPGDCGCHFAHRMTVCGCDAHEITRVSGEVVLRETTHHGDYRHQRDVTLPRAFTGEDVARMAQECPYVYRLSPERAEALADALDTYNRAEHGWTTWEVVSVSC